MIPGHPLLSLVLPPGITLRALSLEFIDPLGALAVHHCDLNIVMQCASSLVIVLPESEPAPVPVIPLPWPDTRRIRP